MTGSRRLRVQAKSTSSPTCSPSICRVAVSRPSSMPSSRPVSRLSTSTLLWSFKRSITWPPRWMARVLMTLLSVSGLQSTVSLVRFSRPSVLITLTTRRV